MKNESKPTPGPWELGTHPANHKLNIIKPVLFGSRVAVLPECEGGHVSIKNIADARLISAAPDLLAACEALLQGCDRDVAFHEALEKARAAIAKARGQS